MTAQYSDDSVMLESEFGLKIKNESSARESFRSIATRARFITERTAEAKAEA